MKNLTKISIITLLTLFIYNCGENLIEEVKKRYDDGKLKVVEYYKKVGDNQELVRIREYYEDGQISGEANFKDNKKDGKWTFYNEDGSIYKVAEYKDGELVD